MNYSSHTADSLIENSNIHSIKKEMLQKTYKKIFTKENCSLEELQQSFYFVRYYLSSQGFFNDKELPSLIDPLTDFINREILKSVDPLGLPSTTTPITKLPSFYDKYSIDLVNDVIILIHLSKIIENLKILKRVEEEKNLNIIREEEVEKTIIIKNEEEEEEEEEDDDEIKSNYNIFMKDLLNSLTQEIRLRFTTPSISFSKRVEGTIISNSTIEDVDKRSYSDAYGIMENRLQITIRNY
jgi:hypothetical protein